MKLNENLKLILRDVHVYDLESCHYNIMKNMGMDLTGIDPNDKLQRNIAIGKMMRSNPRLTSLLRTTTESIINDYINKNSIKENEIIIRQYDGLILTRTLKVTNIGHMPLERRKTFSQFIISIDRKMYIAKDNNLEMTVKGMTHKYEEMTKIYEKLCHISTLEKNTLFTELQKLKDNIFNTNYARLFAIPTTTKGKVIVFLKGYGEIMIGESTLRIMDTDDIDKQKYFDFFIEPFTKSIVFENVR